MTSSYQKHENDCADNNSHPFFQAIKNDDFTGESSNTIATHRADDASPAKELQSFTSQVLQYSARIFCFTSFTVSWRWIGDKCHKCGLSSTKNWVDVMVYCVHIHAYIYIYIYMYIYIHNMYIIYVYIHIDRYDYDLLVGIQPQHVSGPVCSNIVLFFKNVIRPVTRISSIFIYLWVGFQEGQPISLIFHRYYIYNYIIYTILHCLSSSSVYIWACLKIGYIPQMASSR